MLAIVMELYKNTIFSLLVDISSLVQNPSYCEHVLGEENIFIQPFQVLRVPWLLPPNLLYSYVTFTLLTKSVITIEAGTVENGPKQYPSKATLLAVNNVFNFLYNYTPAPPGQ